MVQELRESPGNITVQEGFWFSAHEQWKILELPYMMTSAKDVFMNCERARSWHSYSDHIPGLYASVNGVPGSCTPGYVSACGIQSIASQTVTCRDIGMCGYTVGLHGVAHEYSDSICCNSNVGY